MQKVQTPIVKDLVLVGGGHAHLAVLKRFAMQPLPGLRLTLITRDLHTPYSGMLPGYVAGHYAYDDCHIDLARLARLANCRVYHAAVEGLQLAEQRVDVVGRPSVYFDLLSINTGSTPAISAISGADRYAIIAKPIDRFLLQWEQLQSRVLAADGAFPISIVGGGAGGVELALAIQYRLSQLINERSENQQQVSIRLITKSDTILPSFASSVRKRFYAILQQRGIEVIEGVGVAKITADSVWLDDHSKLPSSANILVTDAAAPDWFGASGLAVDEAGFIRVNGQLQSLSHDNIFAAGDIASLAEKRPKSGVYAVRQGRVLSQNLRHFALQKPLKKYHAQKVGLSLIGTGDQAAVASRRLWTAGGAWVWRLKNWIDQRFVRQYSDFKIMQVSEGPNFDTKLADEQAMHELSALAMRCGGCGAKVGSSVLSRVMQRLPQESRSDVLVGRDAPDDCAVIAVPEGKLLVQSVDYFRAFIDDPYLFGAIASNHALGDVFAMGAEAQSVLAIATVPYARERVVEETLYDVLAGCLHMLQGTGAILTGGHSAEGAELSFGLSVNGLVNADSAWSKAGLQVGDALLLTKPIGTGTLFAADMRAQAKGRWIDSALDSMMLSSQQAAQCLLRYQVSACTDLTGFGLLGHLLEMTKASQVNAELYIDQLPVLDGAQETVDAGILSSLQPQNLRLKRVLNNLETAARHARYPLLFDPQTAGGLLVAVPPEQAEACRIDLIACGYADTAIIGTVLASNNEAQPLRIVY